MHEKAPKPRTAARKALAMARWIAERDAAMFLFFFLWILLWLNKYLDAPFHWDAVGYVSHHAYNIYENNLFPFITGDYNVGHPTLMFWALAAAWKIFGVSLAVSHIVIFLGGALFLLYTYKIGRRLGLGGAAFWTTLMMSLLPLVASQCAQLQIDVPYAAFFTAASYYILRGDRPGRFIVFATAMVLTKITGVILLAPMALFVLARSIRASGVHDRRARLRRLAPLVVPLAALALFLVLRYVYTGSVEEKFFGKKQTELSFDLERFLSVSPWHFWAILYHGHGYVLLGLALAGVVLTACIPRLRKPASALGQTLPAPSGPNVSPGGFALYAVATVVIYLVPHVMRTLYGPIARHYLVFFPLFAMAGGWALGRFWRWNRPVSVILYAAICALLLFHWHPKYAEDVPFPFLKRFLTYDAVATGAREGETSFQWVDFARTIRRIADYVEETYPEDVVIVAHYPEDVMFSRYYNGYVAHSRRVLPTYDVKQGVNMYDRTQFLEVLKRQKARLYVRSSKSTSSLDIEGILKEVGLRLVRRESLRAEFCELYEIPEPKETTKAP